jgi:hypothetical protein
MQLRVTELPTRAERRREKRKREARGEFRGILILFAGFFALALTAEYENPLILFAFVIALALRILWWEVRS